MASVEDYSDEHGTEEIGKNEVECGIERPGTRWVDWKVLWSYTGPGWLMSMAYLDPGNLESDLQAGAFAGYELLWVLFWATVFGLVLQVMAARLGVVTGKHLAEVCREEYSRPVALVIFAMTQIAIIGSDIQEVVGSAIAMKVLSGGKISLVTGCLITGCDTFSFLFLQNMGMRFLEAFFCTLILIMAICFWINYGVSSPSSSSVAYGTVVPELSSYATVQALGLLGAVIMPHNIYLHSALVLSRKIDRADRTTKGSRSQAEVATACKYNAIECSIALLASFFINLAVVACFAQGFFSPTCAPTQSACVSTALNDDDGGGAQCTSAALTIQFPDQALPGTCRQVGLADAGESLGVLLGSTAKYVFAVGVLAAGQASTMTGTYAGQYVMEGFLQLNIPNWQRVLVTRLCSLGPAMAVALATSGNSTAADVLDEWLNILQSVQLPFALLPVLQFTSSRRIMGEWRNTPFWQAVCWGLAVLVIVSNFYLVIDFITDESNPVPHTSGFYAMAGLLGAVYFAFIVRIIKEDILDLWGWATGNPRTEEDRADLDKPLLADN